MITRHPAGAPASTGGQFKAEQRPATDAHLTVVPAYADLRRQALAEIERMYGPGMAATVIVEAMHCRTEEGAALYLTMLSRYGMSASPQQADDLAALGYGPDGDMDALFLLTGKLNPSTLITHQVAPDRARVLAGPPLLGSLPFGWAREGLLEGDLNAVRGVLETWGSLSTAQRYVGLVGAGNPDRARRAQQMIDAGCLNPKWIESGADLETLQGLKACCGSADPVTLAAGGHTAQTVKAYGVKVCQGYALEDLAASGIPAVTFRALHSADPGPGRIPRFRALVEHGVTKTGDVRLLNSVLEQPTPERMGQVVKTFGPKLGTLRAYQDAMRRQRPFKDSEVEAVAVLAGAGFEDPAKTTALWRSLEPEASRHDPGAQNAPVLPVMAAIVANMTPQRAVSLSRAGIPATRLAEFKDSTDPWADGAPFRAHYEAEEQRQADAWATMRGPARKWPHSRKDVDA